MLALLIRLGDPNHSYIHENLDKGEPKWVSRWGWRMDSNQIITEPWQEGISNPADLFIQLWPLLSDTPPSPGGEYYALPRKLDVTVSLGEVDRETGKIYWSTDDPQWTLFDDSQRMHQGRGPYSIDLHLRLEASLKLQVTVDKSDYRAIRVIFKVPEKPSEEVVTPQTELRTFAAKCKS